MTISPMDFTVEQVVSVHDGDTCRLLLDLGFRIKFVVDVRIHNIDTPELFGVSKAAGLVAKAALEKWLAARTGRLRFLSEGFDKYGGRWVGGIYEMTTKEGAAEYLVERKLAHLYDGNKKTPWTAEELAFAASLTP